MFLMEQAFDPDFASPPEWAAAYRACGLQVIPARPPVVGGEWKIPAVDWKEFQENLIPDSLFDRWYGPNGDHSRRDNMGLITGRASGNIFVIDLDLYKSSAALSWWLGILAIHNNGSEPETWEQITGGGGRQLFFKAPMTWKAPTNRTDINVDIRGQGGFAVLPPSLHESRRNYAWKAGAAPWEGAIANAPQWLLDEVDKLVREHGGKVVGGGEKTPSPAADYNDFNLLIDGREDHMTRLVWGAVLDWYRECPIKPDDTEQRAKAAEKYLVYEADVSSRLVDAGRSKTDLLEQESRGASLFWVKWQVAMDQWDTNVAEAANKPKPGEFVEPDFEAASAKVEEQAKTNPAALFEYLSVDQIKQMPDPDWLISGLVVEQSLGFIYGPPGCLKTFIALDMALSFTVGMPDWWGRAIERKSAVVYISSEGQADLKFRIQAWEQHNKVLADDTPFYLIRQTINFMKQEDVGKLLATVQAIADLAGVPVMAVFVDTVSRVLPGSDENLQKDMTLFVAACDAVRQRFGATVIGLHHTSRNGNIRGSTVIPGAGDFLVEVRREPGALTGSIFATKIKSAEDGWEQHFKVEKIQLGDFPSRSSLVVAPVDVAPKREGGPLWPDKDTCRQILAAIHEQWEAGKPWCFAKNSSRAGVPNIMKRWRLKRDVATDILVTWNANGVICEDVRNKENHITGYRKLIDI